jgi:translocator protein
VGRPADQGTRRDAAHPVRSPRALRRLSGGDDRRRVESVFGLQLVLNLAWSFALIPARSPAAGLAVILVLWASIVATIVEFSRFRRTAAATLVPYLAWVTFASVLNAEIWRLNRS